MQSMSKDELTFWQIWCKADWCEKLGILVVIGIPVSPIFVGILQFIGIVPTR